MKLSAAIMAHPLRKSHVDVMLDILDIDDRKFTVTWDEFGDGLWSNARAAWSSYDRKSDYHLVLQDDTLPCPDLLAGTENALAKLALHPGSFMSLFCGHQVIKHAMNSGKTWVWEIVAPQGPAMAMPTDAIDDFLDWCDMNVDPILYHDDYRVSMYMLATNRLMYYTAPCLVEHLGNARTLTETMAVRQALGTRQAAVFLGADKSALDVNWGPVARTRRGQFGDPYMYRHWYIGPGHWYDILRKRGLKV